MHLLNFKLTIFSIFIFFSIDIVAQIKMLENGKVGFAENNPEYGQIHIGKDGVSNGLAITNGSGVSLRFFRDQNWGYVTRNGGIKRGMAIGPLGNINFDSDDNSSWGNILTSRVSNNLSKTFIVQNNGSQNFYVRGDGHVFAVSSYITSDARLKENLKKITNFDDIYNLTSYSYNLTDKLNAEPINNSIDNDKYETPVYFGLLAQELQKIYPELVSENEHGYLSVNYIGLIPVMIEALKKQKEQIDDLQNMLTANKSDFGQSSSNKSVLFQNTPNPFSDETKISYFIDESSINADIYLYDLQGKQLKRLEIKNKGNGSFTVNSFDLDAGIYLYTLIVDGEEVESKRLILTD